MDINRKASSNFKKKQQETMKTLLDLQTLDFYCRYVVSENSHIRASGLNLVKNLFSRINPEDYNDAERKKRIEFINRGLHARLVKKLSSKTLILQYINGGISDKPLINENFEEISDETLAYLNEQAAELSKYYFVDEKWNNMVKLVTDLKNYNYTRRSDVVDQIQALTNELHLRFNKIDDSTNSSSMFTLVPGEFEESVTDTYARETSPSRILRSGMTGLNTMLDGGFQANRVYLILAQAAGGKSFTMLDLAIQIKKYNKDYKPHDLTKIPTIVFLTMENSKDENVSRMLNMTSGKSFSSMSLEESFDTFRKHDLGYDPVEDPIDLVMIYRPNLSENTDYLYTLVDKLKESGREPICFFQDHIKRIRPVNKHNDMRLDLGEVINEFKAFANEVGIPVITDSHLNRDAAKVIDESSSKSNKMDLIRNLGSHNISESFLMIDNCDVGLIINKEIDSKENQYMGFKCVKTRTRCDLELFYQPYEISNDIKLQEDLYSNIPVFKNSLKEDKGVTQPMTRYSRYTNFDSSRDDDSEDFFGAANMAKAKPIDTLQLNNNSQSSFVVVGGPSDPVYMNYNQQDNSQIKTPWELELEQLSKLPNMKDGINFTDDNGNFIGNGLTNFNK